MFRMVSRDACAPLLRAALFLAIAFSCGCARLEKSLTVPLPASGEPAALPGATDSTQLLVVLGEGGSSPRARLYALERTEEGWTRHLGPFPAMVGRKGFAPPGAKVEGDGRTPTGLYPLELVFGYAPGAATRMPYRQATENDLWVDDVNSPDYNRWKRRGETSAASFETMKLADRRYRHGVVIGYNEHPVVKGKGSAIFLHVWLEEGSPTSGCVALDEENLVGILGWLDPARHPGILMGNYGDLKEALAAVAGGAP